MLFLRLIIKSVIFNSFKVFCFLLLLFIHISPIDSENDEVTFLLSPNPFKLLVENCEKTIEKKIAIFKKQHLISAPPELYMHLHVK